MASNEERAGNGKATGQVKAKPTAHRWGGLNEASTEGQEQKTQGQEMPRSCDREQRNKDEEQRGRKC